MLSGLYERAITEADRRRWEGEAGAEEALRSFWSGYLNILVSVSTLGAPGILILLAAENDRQR